MRGSRGSFLNRESPSAVGGDLPLQRIQECNQLILLVGRQVAIIVDHVHSLIAVTQDSIVTREVSPVVHQAVMRAHSPQWRSAHHVGCALSAVLYDTIACSDVVQQEIAVRMDDLVAERRRYSECALIDDRARRSGSDRGYVADVATDRIEELCAGLGI